jgi:hypothetical protein
VLVNLKSWEQLPVEYKAVIESAAAEANLHVTAQYDTRNPQAMRKLVSEGAQLRAFPRPVMEAAYKAAFELYDELSAKSPQFKKIYGPWRKYRDDAYLWFRVAEQSFDNFVYAQSAKSEMYGFPRQTPGRAPAHNKSPLEPSPALPWVWLIEKPPPGGFFFYPEVRSQQSGNVFPAKADPVGISAFRRSARATRARGRPA